MKRLPKEPVPPVTRMLWPSSLTLGSRKLCTLSILMKSPGKRPHRDRDAVEKAPRETPGGADVQGDYQPAPGPSIRANAAPARARRAPLAPPRVELVGWWTNRCSGPGNGRCFT